MPYRLWKKAPDVNPKQRTCSRTETALIKLSQRFHGISRLGEVLHLQGPYISLEKLNEAVTRLQYRHPALRSRVQSHPTNRERFVFEEDETLRLPVEEIARKREEHASFWVQEWRKREREPLNIGDSLARLWLLQDPNDKEDMNAFREVVLMCEHSICDGLSLSNAAHELLQILSDETGHAHEQPLPWGETMEHAIRNSLSAVNRVFTLSRFLLFSTYTLITNRLPVARMPFAEIDFDTDEMDKYCHTEIFYGVLNKEMTTKLVTRCHQQGVTVTSAVISAVLSAIPHSIPIIDDRDKVMIITLSADTRRRCIPPVSNHHLSYHASGIGPFRLRVSAAPKTSEGSWQLTQTFDQHTKTCVNAGQVLGCGMITPKAYEMSMGPINMTYMPTYGMSSWGLLPFSEQYGPWQLTAMTPFMNLLRAAFPFTIIQTVNGVLTVMFGGACPLIPANLLIALRDRSMDVLQQMIAN